MKEIILFIKVSNAVRRSLETASKQNLKNPINSYITFAKMKCTAFFSDWHNIVFFCFCLISFVQVFYYLFFFLRLTFYKPKSKQVSQTHPISVVVCARDEAGNLAMNLPGILVQHYHSTHEVIVVNDNSFDDSKYVLEAFKKNFKQLQIVELKQEAKMIPGKKFPLSVGIKTAKHEILLLTDADCVPASELWIEKMQSMYDDETEIVLGYAPFHHSKSMLNKIVRWECYHSALQYFSYALAGMPYMGVGRNLSYRKKLFLQTKGFSSHNHISGGDDDLFINMVANKKNTKLMLDPDSFMLSKPATTWKQWKRQKNRHYSTGKYYQFKHQFLLGLYSFSHFLYYPLLISSFIFFDWKWVLGVFGIRFILQLIVHRKCTNRLGEHDLFPLFLLMDIWMFVYYLIFAPSLVKKQMPHWK